MLNIILWKHFIVRFNRITSFILTLCELIIPIAAFLVIISAKSHIRDLEKVYVNESTYIDPVPKDEILTRINVGSTKILYAPDTKFTEDLIREIQLKLSLYNEDIKCFENRKRLINYYNTYEKSGITVAILFEDVGHKIPKHLNYEIMIHEDGVVWDTDKLFTDLFTYIPGMGSEMYMDKTYGAVQVALDLSFIEMASNKKLNFSLELQEFPYPPHMNTDGVTTAFRFILPFMTILSFIFICPVTLKRIVLEKSSGLKELLKIGGCKSLTLWFGWYLNGIIINAISSLCIAFILTQNLFSSTYPVIEYCNVAVLALFLFLYCSATVAFFFAFSTCFNKASLAMVLGVLLWITSYSIFVAVAGNVDVLCVSIKALFSLFPTIALHYGYSAISLFELREKHLSFCTLFESPTSSHDDLSLGQVMVMLIFNTILYFVLALYMDKIWPGPYGIPKPWYFLIDKLTRKLCKRKLAPEPCEDGTSSLLAYYEESDREPLLRLNRVTKAYENNIAVNNLSIDIYKGTITSLLGENGAGKTTTMSMLTGLTKATKGEILVGGCNINDDVELARKRISICTQGDLLYDELTVKQHLQLFGMLKGLSAKDANKQAEDLLQTTLNLSKQSNKFVHELSGGMKRKVSLGIALMGNPEILILDEPTSGVDIAGRQEIWDLILKFKDDKTVLISTHFLEEAEYLSDYIAIMSSGFLLCYGTPMGLKKKYDVGYRCTISQDQNDQSQLQKLNEVLKKEDLQQKFVHKKGNEKFIQCDFNETTRNRIPTLMRTLNREKERGNAITYKFSSSTLEDVYLKVQNAGGSQDKDIRENDVPEKMSSVSKRACNFRQQFKKRWLFLEKKWLHYLFLILLFIGIVQLTFALGTSGYHDVSKDGTKFSMVLSQYGATDVYYSISGTGKEHKLEKYYNRTIESTKSAATKVDDVSKSIIEKGIENIAHYMRRMVIAAEFVFEGDSHLSAVKLWHSNKALHGAPIGINAAMNAILKYCLGEEYSISATNTPLHSNNQKQQALSQSEFSNLFLWITLLPIGPLLLISTVLLVPTIEFSKNTRILEKLNGVTSLEYWLTYFLWDAILYFIAISILCLSFMIPLHSMDWETLRILCYILLAYGFLFIPYAYLFTYTKTVESAYAKFLISHIIIPPILAGILLALEEVDTYKACIDFWKFGAFIINPHIAFCYILGRFSMKTIRNHNWDIMSAERKKYLCYDNFERNPCCEPDSQECADYRACFSDSRLYFLLLMFFAYMISLPAQDFLREWLPNFFVKVWYRFCCQSNQPGEEKGTRQKATDSLLQVRDVTKDYMTWAIWRPKTVKVIKNLSIELTAGKCLGLLGVNGAGKSTSFRILTRETPPTAGSFLAGIDEVSKGYCPQDNALLDDFTGKELLTLHGNLRGQKNVDKVVEELLNKFGMSKIADRPCGTYSGGNKRKLSTCISIIGFPKCILLDEPTSGVDPVSRRELWDIIERIKAYGKSGIILTSHSMDECEVLCDRLCILSNGTVVEDRPIDELKKKHCVGHVVNIKLKSRGKKIESQESDPGNQTDETDGRGDFVKVLEINFSRKNIEVLGLHNAIMYVRIYNSDWLTIFETMEEIKGHKEYSIDDYWVNEASLQDVLMRVAKKHKNLSKSANDPVPV